MKQTHTFFGAFSYEFRMQIRRRALWITFLGFILVILVSGRGGIFRELLINPHHETLLTLIVLWTHNVNSLLPLGIGILLADRLPRDRRTRMDELFPSLPGALSSRLTGKYLGSTVATLIPMVAFYSVGIGCILYQSQNLQAIPLALETFAAIVLPGIVFISTFSIACTAILWVPLYQFLFVAYWFWGNMFPTKFGIPTLSNTILTPVGSYMSAGFFGIPDFQVTSATALQAVESMTLLVVLAIFAIVALLGYLKWEQGRR